jgi:hypothetical protein
VYDWDLLKKQQEQGGSCGPTSTSLCFSLLLLRCRLATLVFVHQPASSAYYAIACTPRDTA